MSAQSSEDEPQHGAPRHGHERPAGKGYETTDLRAGATLRAGLYILGTMFLVAAVVAPLYWFFAGRESRDQERPATLIQASPPPAAQPFPKLVTSEPSVLSQFRARENVVLDGYGWVEKDRGIARMPVAEAIRIVGARGALPSFLPPETDAPATAPKKGGPS